MRVRQENFSPTRALARQFALCRKCPRGFEGPVVLLWKEIPVCQSCYIKELEAWNAKLNEIHGQQTKPTGDGNVVSIGGSQGQDPYSSSERDKTVDTSQETDGLNTCSSGGLPSRPGIHGPYTKAEGQGIESVGDGKKGGVDSRRDINLSLVTVDAQRQGKDEQAKFTALKSKSNKRDGSSSSDIHSPQFSSNRDKEQFPSVDIQSQDCHHYKTGEVGV